MWDDKYILHVTIVDIYLATLAMVTGNIHNDTESILLL